MSVKEIESGVIDILITDGPDGHSDGSIIITAFIVSLLEGNGQEFIDKYRKINNL